MLSGKYYSTLLLSFIFINGTSMAALTDTATVHIDAIFTAPQCTLDVPQKVDLGIIKPGTHTYRPVNIKINCPAGAKQGHLYAETTNLLSGSNEVALMKGNATVQLFLLDANSKRITLNGISGTSFCDGVLTRDCILTPQTWYSSAPTNGGDTSAIINFTLVHP